MLLLLYMKLCGLSAAVFFGIKNSPSFWGVYWNNPVYAPLFLEFKTGKFDYFFENFRLTCGQFGKYLAIDLYRGFFQRRYEFMIFDPEF